MKANEAMKALLTIDNTAPRALHDALHLDFEKDFYIFTIPARFTAKMILKEAAAAGHDPRSSVIAVLTQPDPGYIFADRLNLATLETAEHFNIEYRRAIP